jgi:hypothetical protein
MSGSSGSGSGSVVSCGSAGSGSFSTSLKFHPLHARSNIQNETSTPRAIPAHRNHLSIRVSFSSFFPAHPSICFARFRCIFASGGGGSASRHLFTSKLPSNRKTQRPRGASRDTQTATAVMNEREASPVSTVSLSPSWIVRAAKNDVAMDAALRSVPARLWMFSRSAACVSSARIASV